MAQELIQLTLLLTLSTAVLLFLRMLKQPPLIAYLVSGLIAGPAVLGWTQGVAFLDIFSSIGIAFLLFIVGLDLNYRELKRVGLPSALIALAQVIISSLLGIVLGITLGFGWTESIYLAVAMAFSSTIIIVKLVTDNRDIDTLYGKLSVGVLLVQDIIAIIALIFLGTFSAGHTTLLGALGGTLLKGIIAGLLVWGIDVYLLPSLLRGAGRNQESLFLFSVTWCFIFATAFWMIGLTLEIGALLAGLILGSTSYSKEISSRVKPLRDFFIVLFFIILGSRLSLDMIVHLGGYALAYSLLVVIGIPAMIMGTMGLLGFSKRISFFTGITLAQISEFSLIVIALGYTVGHVSETAVGITTITGILTIAASTWLIKYKAGIYKRVGQYIPFYRLGSYHEHKHAGHHEKSYEVIVFGHNRMGPGVIREFLKNNKEYLIVDYNPDTIIDLTEQGHPAVFGDADDVEFYNTIKLNEAKLVVSTLPTYSTNSLVLEQTRKANKEAIIVLTALQPEEATALYEEGADYVIVPHLLGGDHAANMLNLLFTDIEEFVKHGKKHQESLQEHKE